MQSDTSRPLISILYITCRADWGGGPEHLWQLLQHLPPDFRAHVASPDDYPYRDRYAAIIGESAMLTIPHRAFSIRAFLLARSHAQCHALRLIHSHGKGAGLYGRLLSATTGIPCVHTLHGVHVGGMPGWKRRAYVTYERTMSLLTQRIISVSPSELDTALQFGLCPARVIATIPNGVAIPPSTISAPSEPPLTIAQITRYDFAKNSDFLLDVMEQLRHWGELSRFRFVLVGDGPGRPGFKSALVQRGLTDFMNMVDPRPDPFQAFTGALCYLSTSRWEGMPLAVLEAKAHGLAPVVTDVVGNRDVVEHGKTGLLFPCGDAAACARSLITLANDQRLRQSLAAEARSDAEKRHAISICADRTFDLCRQVLDEAR